MAAKRLVADVSAVGDPLTGFDIYDSYKCGVECEFPEGGRRLGDVRRHVAVDAADRRAVRASPEAATGWRIPGLTLYGREADASSRFDVTSGGNGICGGVVPALCGEPNREIGALVDCEGTTACDAAPGFDGPSGVGTPKGLGLFKPDLPTAVITPPASLGAGKAAAFSAAELELTLIPAARSRATSGTGGTGARAAVPTDAHLRRRRHLHRRTDRDRQLGLTSAQVTTSAKSRRKRPARPSPKKKRSPKRGEEEALAKKKAEEEALAQEENEEEALA